jgi:hypothetical protein
MPLAFDMMCQTQRNIASGFFDAVTMTMLDGVPAPGLSRTGSSSTLWVDPASYLPTQAITMHQSGGAEETTFTWLMSASSNLVTGRRAEPGTRFRAASWQSSCAQVDRAAGVARLPVPAGQRHRMRNGADNPVTELRRSPCRGFPRSIRSATCTGSAERLRPLWATSGSTVGSCPGRSGPNVGSQVYRERGEQFFGIASPGNACYQPRLA